MFKRILALIWLRTQVLLTNKKHFGTGSIPILYGSTLPKFYEYRWHSRENTIV